MVILLLHSLNRSLSDSVCERSINIDQRTTTLLNGGEERHSIGALGIGTEVMYSPQIETQPRLPNVYTNNSQQLRRRLVQNYTLELVERATKASLPWFVRLRKLLAKLD